MTRPLNRSSSVEQTEDDLLTVPKGVGHDYGYVYKEPMRNDPVSEPARPHKPRAKKDTKRWCKGKVGREHVLVIEIDSKLSYVKDGCGWSAVRYYIGKKAGFGKAWHWRCKHHEVCSGCGKVFRYSWDIKKDCPAYGPHPQVEGVDPPRSSWF